MFFKKCVLAMVGAVLLGGGLLSNAQAQVINSGPSANSANSQVTLSATVPSVIFVNVSPTLSVLSATVDPSRIDSPSNIVSTDFQIRGNVVVNKANANVQCTVNTLNLALANGTDTINTILSGTIGGTTINTSGFSPAFTNRQAAIVINGDLNESTVTSLKAPGTYSGTLTITATVL